jgi:hypothetical protein
VFVPHIFDVPFLLARDPRRCAPAFYGKRGSSCGKFSHYPNPTLCILPVHAVALPCGSFASSPRSQVSKDRRSNAKRATTAFKRLPRLSDRPFDSDASQNVRFGSQADMCGAKAHVCFTPDSDRKSGPVPMAMSALPPKADMCSAASDVGYGPKADI